MELRLLVDVRGARAAFTGHAGERGTARVEPFQIDLRDADRALEPAQRDVAAIVRATDTVPGVEEGLNAGMWAIGLAVSGNEVGLPLKEVKALPPAQFAQRRTRAYTRMLQAGAHYVVDDITGVMPCLDDIERRMALGERP